MPESRKRKRKAGTARPGRPAFTRLPPAAEFEVLDQLDVARRFRPDCSECHSPIVWSQLGAAVDVARLPSQRATATRFMVEQGLEGASLYWACTVCDNCGVFGPFGGSGTHPPFWAP